MDCLLGILEVFIDVIQIIMIILLGTLNSWLVKSGIHHDLDLWLNM